VPYQALVIRKSAKPSVTSTGQTFHLSPCLQGVWGVVKRNENRATLEYSDLRGPFGRSVAIRQCAKLPRPGVPPTLAHWGVVRSPEATSEIVVAVCFHWMMRNDNRGRQASVTDQEQLAPLVAQLDPVSDNPLDQRHLSHRVGGSNDELRRHDYRHGL
jgi:hypothetical protein